jgi:hypothetical protein
MGENCLDAEYLTGNVMDLVYQGYDYEEALDLTWSWARTKKRAYAASKHMLANTTQETPNE